MSGFTALNVEPEENFEEEIDDTKELQLEEAFKLYNNALRLHAQGPEHYDEAFTAYADLIQGSDLFKDAEFTSAWEQDQLDDHDTTDPAAIATDDAPLALVPSSTAENAANSIPQLIFLAFKNRGQFVLEFTRLQLQRNPTDTESIAFIWTNECLRALQDFASALERDDSDLDLWKKAARVAEVFPSRRIVRFCLESVLAGDDDGSGEAIDLSGLDEAFAAGELSQVLGSLDDSLSQQQMPDIQPKQPLLKTLRKYNNPFPFLPQSSVDQSNPVALRRPRPFQRSRHEMKAGARSWLVVGQKLLETVVDDQQGLLDLGSGAAVSIYVPDVTELCTEEASQPKNSSWKDRTSNSVQTSSVTGATDGIGANGIEDDMVDSPEKEDVPLVTRAKEQKEKQSSDDSPVDVTEEGASDAPNISGTSAPVNLPTRKRSSTVAGNEDAPEARSKSKRLRARESIAEFGQADEEAVSDLSQYYQDQLETYTTADQVMFSTFNDLLSKAGAETVVSYETIKAEYDRDLTGESSPEQAPQLSDLRNALLSWTDEMSQAILYGHGSQDLGGKAGLTLFLQHSKANSQQADNTTVSKSDDGLAAYMEDVNSNWTNIHEASILWLETLLCKPQGAARSELSSYLRETWSSELKQTVVHLMHREDDQIYASLQTRLHAFEATKTQGPEIEPLLILGENLFEFVQTLFELHLDVHLLITNPSSQVDQETRTQQSDRLCRWADLTSECFEVYKKSVSDNVATDGLLLRFVWASTICAIKSDELEPDHVMLCLQDLEKLMDRADAPNIILPNNAAMPEISPAAAQQEMSRLSTLDFFTSVFDNDSSDPVAVIERLEPILEPSSMTSPENADEAHLESDGESMQVQKLTAFLESGDVSLKLYLWKKLRDAYVAISYNPKTVSCNLRAIETIMSELRSHRHLQASPVPRTLSMLKWLKDADDMVSKLLVKVLHDPNVFECIDESHLRSSISAVAQLSKILHGFAMVEDAIKVGQMQNPIMKSSSSTRTFEKSKDRLREMQVRAWTLQFALLKEATVQLPHDFSTAADSLADYLRSVHHALGLRQYCRYSNKVFLKLVKSELLATHTSEDYSEDVFQVLFDLHQLKFAPGIGDLDHGCPPEPLDKKTATQMVEIVMPYVDRMSIKDILKNELKATIDKIQQALGSVKPSADLSHNKRIITQFLKSQINPKELYRCIKGIGHLGSKPVPTDSAIIARHGWYFLLGHIALTRFKSVKRINPTPTDDLDYAATFFRHDLEHDNEKWESWYRLAQIYDAKIEEDLVWNVSKINDHRPELATLQRHAIHAYTMAVATALRNVDDSPENTQKISEMYTDFACRLYASSRQPLAMDAFKTDHTLRHYSSSTSMGMYKAPPYHPMQEYAVWNFAAYLLRRRLSSKPKPWSSYYTLGKCLWKMYTSKDSQLHKPVVHTEHVLDAFVEAIEALPTKKDSRGEYILEPHFKLASIVHKMVHRKSITPERGVEYLQATHYARKIILSRDEFDPDWEQYILEVLKKLGQADKLNWHHRIIARAAHILYDDTQDLKGALGAKHEFTQQIFTKTMTMQVWKPEHERAGRHYVYTTRYVSFFVTLLDSLNDRANFDLVLRRVRRKPTEFLEHQKLWEEITLKYARLLRRMGKIPEGKERSVLESVSFDEFSAKAEQMEKWAHDPDTTSVLIDVLRDAIELKKLNNSLMKGPVFDDLISDTYAAVYEAFISQLPLRASPENTPSPAPPPLPPQQLIQSPFAPLPSSTQTESWDRMRLGNVLGPQIDGTTDLYSRPPPIHHPVGLGLQNSHLVIGSSSSMQPSVSFEPPRIPMPVKPGRVKQITKRELIRRAESAIVKPPPIKTPILSKKPIVEIEISGTPTRQGLGMGTRVDGMKEEEEGGGLASEVSSRRGSLHDSADDESELSEVELEGDGDADVDGEGENEHELEHENDDNEDAGGLRKLKTIFPGLKAEQSKEESSPTGQDDIEMGDGDGDGDEEDDGEAVWHDAAEDPHEPHEGVVEIPDSQEKGEDDEEDEEF